MQYHRGMNNITWYTIIHTSLLHIHAMQIISVYISCIFDLPVWKHENINLFIGYYCGPKGPYHNVKPIRQISTVWCTESSCYAIGLYKIKFTEPRIIKLRATSTGCFEIFFFRWLGMNWAIVWQKCRQQMLSICGNSFKTFPEASYMTDAFAFSTQKLVCINRMCGRKVHISPDLLRQQLEKKIWWTFWGTFIQQPIQEVIKARKTS